MKKVDNSLIINKLHQYSGGGKTPFHVFAYP